MKKSVLIVACVVLLGACGSSDKIRTSATGTIYECVCVMDSIPGIYDMVRDSLEVAMDCLPQPEKTLLVSMVRPKDFDNYLKPARNVLVITIDSLQYPTLKVKLGSDVWSHPQAVCRITVPNKEVLKDYWTVHGGEVREWFVKQELIRQAEFYRAYRNKDLCDYIADTFGIRYCIPQDYMFLKDTVVYLRDMSVRDDDVRLVWACDPKGSTRKDFVIYSYPYIANDNFTCEFLCKRRDEVLSQVISASVDGSYMGTEYNYVVPQMRAIAGTQGQYVAEVRGLWKICNGEAMGGPFVSHTQVDTVHQRVITTEVFVYAGGQKKRNTLRKSEAILYTN